MGQEYFSVKLPGLAAAERQLNRLEAFHDRCIAEAVGTISGLKQLSGMDSPLRRLARIREGMQDSQSITRDMRRALEQIQQIYAGMERVVMDRLEFSFMIATDGTRETTAHERASPAPFQSAEASSLFGAGPAFPLRAAFDRPGSRFSRTESGSRTLPPLARLKPSPVLIRGCRFWTLPLVRYQVPHFSQELIGMLRLSPTSGNNPATGGG